jgi:hypothetical protein
MLAQMVDITKSPFILRGIGLGPAMSAASVYKIIGRLTSKPVVG